MTHERMSRRKFLAAVMGVSTVGLSGCGSDDGGTETPGENGATETPTATPTPTADSTPTETPEPTATPEPTETATETPEPTATPTATPGASSFASWPRFMRNNEHWGHHPDAQAPHGEVSVDWKREFDQDRVNATAVLADGTLYVGAGGAGDKDGSFNALDPVTGETRWSKDTDAAVTSAAAIDSGFAYVGVSNGRLYALKTSDGSEFWNYEIPSAGNFTAPVVADGEVYVGGAGSRVYNFDALDSTQKWNQSTYGAINASPVFADGTVYAPSGDHDLYAITTGGSVEWTNTLGSSVNGVSHRKRRLYVATEDSLHRVNTSGQRGWTASSGSGFAATPAVTEERVFAGTRDGTLFAFDTGDGFEQWRFTAPSNGVTAPPVVADGTVYVGSRDGSVYAVDTETGDPEWTFETDNNINEAAPVVAGGRVYIGSQDGTFYALSE